MFLRSATLVLELILFAFLAASAYILAPVVVGSPSRGLAAAGGPRPAAATTLAWHLSPSMAGGRAHPGVAADGTGTLYSVGGVVCDELGCDALDSVDVLVPGTAGWARRAPMPSRRYRAGVALAADGRLYAVGGTGRSADGTGGSFVPVATVEAYDPAADAWTTRASLPTPLVDPVVAAAPTGRLYALGGRGDEPDQPAMWEYDPTADVWTPRAVAPASACCLGLTAGRDGRLYAVGSTAAAYDPRVDAWTLGATRPSDDGCCEGAAAPGDGRVYAVGATTTHVYDPAADRWTVLPGPADARHAFGVGAAGGALYAVGGTTDIQCFHCYATSAIAEGRPFEGIPLQRQALLPFVPRAALPN